MHNSNHAVRLRAFVALLLLTALMAVSATPALAARGHVFGKALGWGVLDGKEELQSCSEACQPGIAGSGNGQFKGPAGVAVNEATGDVYVVERGNNRVERFSAAGAYIGQFDGSGTFPNEEGKKAPEPLLEPEGIAIDNSCVQLKLAEPACKEEPSNGDVYVQDGESHAVIDKFTSTGAFINQVPRSPETKAATNLLLNGIAVDPLGGLWVEEEAGGAHHGVDNYSNGEVNRWSEFQSIEPPEGAFANRGLAVDSKDNLYVRTDHNVIGTVVEFNAKGELLNKELDSEFPAVAGFGVATEASTDDIYINNIGSVGRFGPLAAGKAPEIERFGAGHLTAANPLNYQSGVAVDSSSGAIYVADSAANDVVEFPLEPPGPPTIERESLSEVTATSASFQAEINPRGATTEYHFEYGPCTTPSTCAESPYEKSVPQPPEAEGTVGAALDFEAHQVSTHPQDLKAATTYHFRAVAHNEKNKPGEVVRGEEKTFTTQPEEAFELPDGRAWEMVSPPHKHGTLIQRIGVEGVIEAAAAGDAMTYLADSPTEDEPQGYSNLVQVLAGRHPGGWSSQDIGLPHEKATGQSVGQGQEYRLFAEDLSLTAVQPFGAFEPSLSAEATEQTPYERTNFLNGNVEEPCVSDCLRPLVTSAPNPFGEEGKCPPAAVCGPRVAGASPDASHMVIESQVGLSSTPGDEGGLYEWTAGSLQLVSVLPGPGGKPAEHANLGSSDLIARHAVSADGTRVAWSARVGGKVHLYLRDTAKEETVELDEGVTLTGTPAKFETASADDARVFFTENGDLYLYDTETGKAAALTSKAALLGLVIAASEDGAYVYFVGNGALTEHAVNGTCTGSFSATNECNLYELHEAGGTWEAPRLVAVLSGEDLPDFRDNLPHLTARVSPDGTHLAFMSQRSLTGYDNRDAHSGKRDEEVYLYDAETEHVACASCDPTGARPAGVEYGQLGEGLVAGFKVWQATTWLAANVPGWTPYKTCCAFYQSRYLANSGRLFFNSSDSLVSQDVNGTEDVYQYEPPGVGGCSTQRSTYSAHSGGCVDLISSGTSREESGFLDASESGGDVFFLTASKLVKADFDTALDIYDAHECSLSPCIPEGSDQPPPCTTEASCKASPTPQPEIFGAPASATFSGLGNLIPSAPPPPKPPTRAQLLAKALTACKKKHARSRKRRTACVRQAKKRYGARAKAKVKKRGRGAGR